MQVEEYKYYIGQFEIKPNRQKMNVCLISNFKEYFNNEFENIFE